MGAALSFCHHPLPSNCEPNKPALPQVTLSASWQDTPAGFQPTPAGFRGASSCSRGSAVLRALMWSRPCKGRRLFIFHMGLPRATPRRCHCPSQSAISLEGGRESRAPDPQRCCDNVLQETFLAPVSLTSASVLSHRCLSLTCTCSGPKFSGVGLVWHLYQTIAGHIGACQMNEPSVWHLPCVTAQCLRLILTRPQANKGLVFLHPPLVWLAHACTWG